MNASIPASKTAVEAVEFPPSPTSFKGQPQAVVRPDAPFLGEIKVSIEARLGLAEMSVTELLGLKTGSLVPLDVGLGEPIELRLNNATIARGEMVAIGEQFGVKITEILESR